MRTVAQGVPPERAQCNQAAPCTRKGCRHAVGTWMYVVGRAGMTADKSFAQLCATVVLFAPRIPTSTPYLRIRGRLMELLRFFNQLPTRLHPGNLTMATSRTKLIGGGRRASGPSFVVKHGRLLTLRDVPDARYLVRSHGQVCLSS
jgi:hypothetical protein